MFALLKKIIDTVSITGSEGELGHWLSHWLIARGYSVQRQPLSEERFNLLACANRSPRVLFCTHLDTVAPFHPFREGHDRIWGRGACDAKGILWAMLMAGDRLRQSGCTSFGFLLVVGEELASDGAKKAAELNLKTEYIVLGEPTDNCLVNRQKGALLFRINVTGRSGHSGYPAQGSSAIHRLVQVVNSLLQTDWGFDPELGESTLNIGSLSGGEGANIIADHAQADGLFRLAGPADEIVTALHAFEDEQVQIQILSQSPAQQLFTLPGYPSKTVSFGSDAAYLKPLAKVLLIGPGSIHMAHRADEHIQKSDLLAAVPLYEKMVVDLLKLGRR